MFEGCSDSTLVKEIKSQISKAGITPPKGIVPAAGLVSGIRLQPAEALHRLALATQPPYPDELIELYQRWAPLRYLGFFAHDKAGRLVVSDAGREIRGNQRRVTSEELGIGFAVRIAEDWIRDRGLRPGLIEVVDVDLLRKQGFLKLHGRKLTVEDDGKHPDYLLIAHVPGSRWPFRLFFLECKGTARADYAVRQLAGAVIQLDGIQIGGAPLPGLAVSTVTSRDTVAYRAVELECDGVEAAPDDRRVARGNMRTLDDEATFAALRIAWTALADFGGNLRAAAEWAQDERHSVPAGGQGPPRRRFGTPYGSGYAWGVERRTRVNGRTLTIRRGIDGAVDEELARVNPTGLLDAQSNFAQSLAETEEPPRAAVEPGGRVRITSAGPNGSILSIIIGPES